VVRWEILPDEEGYAVRYGIFGGKVEIRGKKEIVLHDLNADSRYYLAVDAFNDSGRTLGTPEFARWKSCCRGALPDAGGGAAIVKVPPASLKR